MPYLSNEATPEQELYEAEERIYTLEEENHILRTELKEAQRQLATMRGA